MKEKQKQNLRHHLEFLYGDEQAAKLVERISGLLQAYRQAANPSRSEPLARKFNEEDVILIAYGDIVQDPPHPDLQTLGVFLDQHLVGQINSLHILPFFLYSSDDGFSVIDYRAIEPKLGTWEDFQGLAKSRKIMVDGVINHISRESEWFKRFQAGDPAYQDFFIQVDDSWDLSQVVRPRTSPLLTEVETVDGPKKVWTTFSADQVDLNYANPEVLLAVLEVLLFYLRMGASIIRLDAIAYLWKESGTTCIHLPQTHVVVKIIRQVLEAALHQVVMITETNVPHLENISYFGEVDPVTGETDEAHMVYQFPLAPLVLHALISGSAHKLTEWAAGLEPTGIFFNFIASHDGIGVLPAKGILTDEELQTIFDQVHRHGGLLSHRSNPDGSKTVYELNTTLYDALNDPEAPEAEDMDRYLASQVILMSLAGVPGIYYHSLFGSRNALDNVQETGRSRSINRKKFMADEIAALLGDPENIHAEIFRRMLHLLEVRKGQPAFDPYGGQEVLRLDERVFGLVRTSLEGDSRLLVLVNVSGEAFDLEVDCQKGELADLISGEIFAPE
ncbi:MAG: sugar phosphorylase, partial [Anaerolineaceae bacterium]|nr:sugar phosphorylase [Anaerolineaceae bacterium]